MITHKINEKGDYKLYYCGEFTGTYYPEDNTVCFVSKYIDTTLLKLVSDYIQNNLI